MVTATLLLVTLFSTSSHFLFQHTEIASLLLVTTKTTLPLSIGVFTMAATWIGGGFINGTAESSYSLGIIATQAPIAYALSMIVGILCFVERFTREIYHFHRSY